MQERYDFPKRRPATKTLNRFSLLKTSPCAQRKDSGCVFTAMYYILVIFCTLPPVFIDYLSFCGLVSF